jgi:hypothetical protein
MPIAPITEPSAVDNGKEDILADPDDRAALEALDDPEDRQDLIDHLMVMRRFRDGKEKATPWEEVKAKLEHSLGFT